MKMGRFFAIAVLTIGGFTTGTQAASVAAVDKAIKDAVAYIYKQENKDGNWEEVQPPIPKPEAPTDRQSTKIGQYTGRTAISVLALLFAGESSSDARIKSAVDFLLKTPTEGTYALGLRCQVWLMLPPSAATKAAMMKDAKILQTSMKQEGIARGMYDYIPTPKTKTYSHSRSQYAVLGMWAAEQMGLEIPDQYWQTIEKAWIDHQDPSGGWGYYHPSQTNPDFPVTPGMTTVGVASLYITQEYLRANEGVSCKGNQASVPIAKGIKWLGDNMDKFATDKKYARDFPYPTLYAYERVGAASGLRYFNGIDWYEKGSDWAIAKQNSAGSWGGSSGGNFSTLVDTCFATLFLAKGRAPLVISKLQYNAEAGKEGNWNQRSRDIANVTRWIGNTIEHELAFQIVDMKAPIENWLESPILYIAGNEAVKFTPEDVAKMKAYVDGGGMILANADCGTNAFAGAIRKLGKDLFPDSEFSELPADDLIYTGYYPRSKWKSKPGVLALDNGARKQMLLIPQSDPAKAWQLEDSKSRIETFELAADITLYAVDQQNLRFRGDRFYVPDDPKLTAKKTIDVARIKYAGFWDPEPGGWHRLRNLMLKKGTAVAAKPAELGKNELGTAKIAHLTGTFEYKFTDAQRDELKAFVNNGGTLVIDAAGGSGKFASSAEALIGAMFPDAKLDVLPPTHPLYTAGGGAADPIAYRQFAVRNGVGHTDAPRLQGITINGRLAVIYSREDLSVGLVGQAVGGIVGYQPTTATALMTRILNYASGAPTTAAPATKPAK